MESQIEAIFCICDDILKGLKHSEDKQRQMNDAEVMTTSIVAALFFSGNMEKSLVFMQEHGYIPKMLAKSRFNPLQPVLITASTLRYLPRINLAWLPVQQKTVFLWFENPPAGYRSWPTSGVLSHARFLE